MIEDDGQEFNCLQVPGNGVGLSNMAVRVEKLEVQHEVRSDRGNGEADRFGSSMNRDSMQGLAQQITVLIVADHEVVRMDLQTLFKRTSGIEVVGEVGTGQEAVQAVRRGTPTVVLMDLHLPDVNGIEVCREIREIAPACKVLFLTSYVDTEAVVATILAGAQGYLLKDVLGEGLVRAIEQVAAGQSVLDPALTARVLTLLQSSDASAGPNPQQLSPQEQQMMVLIVERKTNKEVGQALGLSEKTIRNSLTTVFKKLGATRRSQAAVIYSRLHSSSIHG